MCKQLEDERRHVAISLRQMNKGCSVCVEMRGMRLVFLKYGFTALELSQRSDPARRRERRELINTLRIS